MVPWSCHSHGAPLHTLVLEIFLLLLPSQDFLFFSNSSGSKGRSSSPCQELYTYTVRNTLCPELLSGWTDWTNKHWRGKWRHNFTNWQQCLRLVSCLPDQKCLPTTNPPMNVIVQTSLLKVQIWTNGWKKEGLQGYATDGLKKFQIKWVYKQYLYGSLLGHLQAHLTSTNQAYIGISSLAALSWQEQSSVLPHSRSARPWFRLQSTNLF